MKTQIEQGAYVVLGAFDLLAEKTSEIPMVRKMRDTTLLEQVLEIEPKLRKSADDLSMRGEVMVSKAMTAMEDLRESASGVAGQLRGDAVEQFEIIGQRVKATVGYARRPGSAA